jgi:hypothetical protein
MYSDGALVIQHRIAAAQFFIKTEPVAATQSSF